MASTSSPHVDGSGTGRGENLMSSRANQPPGWLGVVRVEKRSSALCPANALTSAPQRAQPDSREMSDRGRLWPANESSTPNRTGVDRNWMDCANDGTVPTWEIEASASTPGGAIGSWPACSKTK